MSGGSSAELEKVGTSVRKAIAVISPNTKVISLCDLDDKSPAEVAEFETAGNLVLSERNLESFILADDVLEALLVKEKKEALLHDVLAIKQRAIADSVRRRNNPPDDLKSAAGDIYTGVKALLGLTQCGNTSDAFMKDTLAPLVQPNLRTYQALKASIIDRLT